MIQSKYFRSFPSTTAWEYPSSRRLQVLWRRRKAEAQMVDPRWIHLPSRGEKHKKGRLHHESWKNHIEKTTKSSRGNSEERQCDFWGLSRVVSRSVLVMNPGNACRNRVVRWAWRDESIVFCLHGTIAATRRFLLVQPWRHAISCQSGSLVYRISSTQRLKCDPAGNNTPFQRCLSNIEAWSQFSPRNVQKPGGFWRVDFISLPQCCGPQDLRQAAQVNDIPFAASSNHYMELDLKESQPKNMRNKVQGVKKRPIWRQKLLGQKGDGVPRGF